MAIGKVDLRELVRRLATRSKPRTEADVQSDVRTLLLYGNLNLAGNDIEVLLEQQAGERHRIDVEAGNCVIEVKKDLRVGNILPEAVNQLSGYVAQRSHTLQRRYVGLLTDGADWYVYHLEPDDTLRMVAEHHVNSADPHEQGLLIWLDGVLATTERIIPTPIEIARRLGADSPSYLLDKASLTALWAQAKELPSVEIKRELWAKLLIAAFGTHFKDSEDLFVEHTYLVCTAEVIAHAVVGYDLADLEQLDPESMVSGRLFQESAISGVVEPDFFDWLVEVPGGKVFIRTLAHRLARFDWSNVRHDLLKILYESVITPEQRHELGEYYTPDWLADHIIASVVDDPLHQRVLDPACGSGTFLFHAVRSYLAAAEEEGLSNREALDRVSSQVYGVDLHPVAVTLARVTYLLAIGKTRLLSERNDLTIPVFLGDSLLWQQEDNLLTSEGLSLPTSDGPDRFSTMLHFPPQVISDAHGFDSLVNEIVERATTRHPGDPIPSLTATFDRFGVNPAERPPLQESFRIICGLSDKGRDHIWGYYIRNLARPRWLSLEENRVDRLVGNPPWLSYRFMPAYMQPLFREKLRERNISPPAAAVTASDLSAYFVARSCELYLKPGGRLGMVMPAATLQRKAYVGFRKGQYSSSRESVTVSWAEPWELTDIEPPMFPVPSCVVFGERTERNPSAIPSEVVKWSGTLPGRDVEWDIAGTALKCGEAEVIVGTGRASPYRKEFANGATIFPRVLTWVEKATVGPLGQASGRRTVRSSRSNQEKEPWKELKSLKGSVERQFIRRIQTGATTVPFRVLEGLEAVLPIVNGKVLDGSSEEIDNYPGLATWWRQAEQLWLEHRPASSALELSDRIDYQRYLSRQFPIAAHRVVYSRSGTNLIAARLSDATVVVEQTLLWGSYTDPDEAFYLEAVFNSSVFRDRVSPHQSRGQFGARDFTKDVFSVPLPKFVTENDLHREISRIGQESEEIAASLDLSMAGPTSARRMVREALDTSGASARLNAHVTALLDRAS